MSIGKNSSIPKLFLNFTDRQPDASFVFVPQSKSGQWSWASLSRQEALRMVAFFARRLASLGVGKGDRIAIWANTRAEWCLIDLAILSLGGVVVGIYPTLVKDMVLEQLRDAGVSMLIVETEEQVLQWEDDFDQLENLIHLLSIEEGEELLWVEKEMGSSEDVEWLRAQIQQRESSALASIIYTSGTTGQSKGVLLTHHNFLSNLEATADVLPLGRDARSIVCLPLAHSLQRFVVYRAFVEDVAGYFAPSLRDIPETIQAARPTILIGVPRMFEKIQSRMLQQARERSAIALFLVHQAVRIGWELAERRARKESIPKRLKWQHRFLQKLVISQIHQRLGGELRQIISGGAPLADETAKFFWGLGYQVIEGWGLSETCAPATLNLDGVRKLGSVGQALPNVSLKIAANGEILVSGEGVFSGYHQQDSSANFADGFFRTGDLGAVDAEGFVYITGRAKDIIVTAGGKNIAPQRIAQRVQNDLIHHCIVIGDQQRYLVALIAIDEEALQALATEQEWQGSFSDWTRQERLRELVALRVQEANALLASFEQIKRYAILPAPLTEEAGLLTSTQKAKKSAIIDRYQDIWRALYE